MKRIAVLLTFTFLFGCVSSYEDSELASKVGRFLGATEVVPLDAREADKSGSGRIVYVGPGTNGSPHFTYYEVTTLEDMQKLKRAAEKALEQIPEAKKITLHFMEKQVVHRSPDGSSYRGREKEIETIVVVRER
ncbi:MAG: hypothetical protein Q8L56_11985 [Rhodocyclaceae bacterium]|nr:hypothetical protein [Rhodocyclaceae bacterium]